MKGYEVSYSIHGHKIIAEARKVSDPVVIVKSARHKAQRIVLIENALALIDRKGRWCDQGPCDRRSRCLPLPKQKKCYEGIANWVQASTFFLEGENCALL